MQLEFVNIQESEVGEVKLFIEQNLQSSVGYWTEEEVEKKRCNGMLIEIIQWY